MQDVKIEVIEVEDGLGNITNPRYEKAKRPECLSIFLAGPSEREAELMKNNWRHEAIDVIKKLAKTDIPAADNILIYTPLNPNFKPSDPEYHFKQTFWETEALNCCDKIVFWIPRRKDLPGATTNIEIGQWMNDDKTYIGLPPEGIGNTYIKDRLKIYQKDYYEDMQTMFFDVLDCIKIPF